MLRIIPRMGRNLSVVMVEIPSAGRHSRYIGKDKYGRELYQMADETIQYRNSNGEVIFILEPYPDVD